MLVWINGTFGVGKTTTANMLMGRSPGYRLFDPEWVGYMLRANLTDVPVDDFQELRPWRALVPLVAAEISQFTSMRLVAVQTVLVETYWNELLAGFDRQGMDVVHVLLDCEEEALRDRIVGDQIDTEAAGWRLDHISTYRTARDWLRGTADIVVDVTSMAPVEVAATLSRSLH